MSIKIAIAGVGNCASALVQGIAFYRENPNAAGLMHKEIGGYKPQDIEVVAAFDVDRRKVGKSLKEALLSDPNCATIFHKDLPDFPVTVQMGPVLDGISEHTKKYAEERSFSVSDQPPCDVVKVLKESGADMLINYVPVGSEEVAHYYAEACLEANVALSTQCLLLSYRIRSGQKNLKKKISLPSGMTSRANWVLPSFTGS